MAEVVTAVQGLKNGKAARMDEITLEMLKNLINELTDLVNDC